MSEKGITQDRTGSRLQELFKILIDHPDGIQGKDALQLLRQRVELTEHEKGEYEKGGSRFDKIVRFSTVNAVKAGWMRKSKGLWMITEAGEEALKTFSDPGDFYREATRLYWKWRKAQPVDEAVSEDTEPGFERTITFEEAEEQATNDISEFLDNIDPYDLQELVAVLLEAMGYHVAWIAPPGKDRGVDLLAWNDPLGTRPPRIKVQVKRRKDSIPVDELRSFLAVIGGDDVGIFVATSGFTKDAWGEARHSESRKITLIDSQKLVELWIEYNDQIAKEKRHFLPLQPIYFLSPDE